MNEFLWLLWGLLALLLGAAAALVIAAGSAVLIAVFDEVRARHRVRRRRAWVRAALRRGSVAIARDLDRAARRRTGSPAVALVLEHPMARRVRRDDLTAVVDATTEETGR